MDITSSWGCQAGNQIGDARTPVLIADYQRKNHANQGKQKQCDNKGFSLDGCKQLIFKY